MTEQPPGGPPQERLPEGSPEERLPAARPSSVPARATVHGPAVAPIGTT